MNPEQNKVHLIFASGLCALLAIALQCQFKILQSDTYFGLRINLGDILLPFAGLFILASLIRKRSSWPCWHPPFTLLWPIALTAVVGLSLIYGYYMSGEWNSWALINKGGGWLILMAYLAAGAWISTNFDSALISRFFLKPFILFFVLTTFGYCALQILFAHGISIANFKYYNMDGFMGNRNAFAFMFLTMAVIVVTLSKNSPEIIGSKLALIFWALLPACLLLNGSRTMWLGFIAFVLYTTFVHKSLSFRNTLLPAFIGLAVFLALINPLESSVLKRHLKYSSKIYTYSKTLVEKQDLTEEDITTGDHMRFSVYKSALDNWLEQPILGSGLGGNIEKQKEDHGKAIVVVHNTLLWLLSDMGLIGALVFLGAYIVMLQSLFKAMKNKDITPPRQALSHAALLILLLFGIFSVFHEMLYTRFMWFILGLALASPIQALHQSSPPDHQKTS